MRLFYTLLALLFYMTVTAQTGKIIDSLKIELTKQQEDTIRAQVLNDLSYYYLYQNTDTALLYGRKTYTFANTIGYHKVRAKSKLYMGNAFLFSDRVDSAQVYYNRALEISNEHDLDKSAIYSSLGMFYKSTGAYEKATDIYYKGIADDENTGNEYGKFIKLNNLSNVYGILENYEKSTSLLKEAVAISEKSENPNIKYALGTILNGIGSLYIQVNNFDEAILYFNRSLEANLASDNEKEIARNYQNLGAVFEKKNQYQKSLEYLNKAFSIREKLGNKKELSETHFQLGSTYGKLLNTSKSEFHFKSALALAKEIKDKPLIAEIYLTQSNTYEDWNKAQKALASYKAYSSYRDSIVQSESLTNISEIETKYETAKKDKEILEQRFEIEQTSNTLKRRNTLLYYLLGALVLLWLVFRQRQKRKNQEITTLKREHQIKTLESLIQGEEKERFRIAKELHDGVNGDLSAIKFKLTSLLEKNNKIINEAISMIDDSCKQVRAISHNLIPPSLENFNVSEALAEYCENANSIHEPDIFFQHMGSDIKISKNAEINIFRIAQELVANALKHAQATLINVQLSCRDNEIQLTVEDNGIGFNVEVENTHGIGLKNINSRVEYLKADKDMISNKEGTSYTITMDKDTLS
ncbi:signal transduction histidine kinase/Tfp pilus assembly protein PilF [Saonia flava]|uniref:histidine kinase n=1 Tax=Saonia flava TaxID=523696 RepID=A0A846QWI0_9FLAO|nr:sensor histidine kinase [Saonia flava]NJB69935.1 signal transduction histidine kinase/Tfp pilus assembly protein PilF [Saonia flava]